jgi:hypothetical protein
MLEGVVVSMPARPSLGSREPQPASSEAPRRGRKSALLICAERYHRGERDHGGEKDTEKFAALLRDWAGFAVQVLRNPKRAELIVFLDGQIRANSEPDDILLIHFNGHYVPGVEDALFLRSEVVPARDLTAILNRSPAGHQLIIFDGFTQAQSDDDPVSGATEATSLPPRYTREVISSRATEQNGRRLTGLLIEALEHNLDRLQRQDLTFRDLFELARMRDALIESGSVVSHSLDQLKIGYFSSSSTSAVIGPASSRRAQPQLAPGAIFISYAREDQAAANRLCDFLEESGLDVRLDSRQFSAGEDWYEQSRRLIDNCSLFIPLISAQSLRREDGLFRREWTQAAERARRLDPSIPFIIPVVIDDTAADTEDIPGEFRSVQWTRLTGGAGEAAFRDRLIALVNESRNKPAVDRGELSVAKESVESPRIRLADTLAKWFERPEGIEITSPRSPKDDLQDKQPYGDMFSYKVEGKLRRLPEDHEIWLLNVNERSKEVWPQGFAPVTDWDAQTGEWTGRVCGRPVETIKIVAVVAPPTSTDFFNYYQELCDRGIVKPLKRIPPECTNQASIQATLR